MIHILPELIRMFRVQMVESLRFIGRNKDTAAEAALLRARRTRFLVLLQIGTIHRCTTMRTLHTNTVQKAQCEDALVRLEWFFAAVRTRLYLSDTRGAEQSSAFAALTRVCAELSANWALEFVVHVKLAKILFGLQRNKYWFVSIFRNKYRLVGKVKSNLQNIRILVHVNM